MISLKYLFLEWILSPKIKQTLKIFRSRDKRFRGSYSSWDQALAESRGYDDQKILEKVIQATLKVKCCESLFERDSIVFDTPQYLWPITVGLLRAAALHGGDLRVLDIGGSLGSQFFNNKKLLSGLRSVKFSIIEQSHFVAAGKKYFEDENIKFYSEICDLPESADPNIVVFSSSAQYISEIDRVIDAVNQTNAKILVFDRTPFHNGLTDVICTQKVSPEIYDGSYPMRIFSLELFLQRLSCWNIVEKFDSPEGEVNGCMGIKIKFGGILFERRYEKNNKATL